MKLGDFMYTTTCTRQKLAEMYPQTAVIRIVIPLATPSLNKMLRTHFRTRKRHQNEWRAHIWAHIIQHKPAHATSRRRVTVERYGKKLTDTDNGWPGCKYLLDELVKFKLLIDDKSEHCELVFRQEKLKPKCKEHTVVTLEDI